MLWGFALPYPSDFLHVPGAHNEGKEGEGEKECEVPTHLIENSILSHADHKLVCDNHNDHVGAIRVVANIVTRIYVCVRIVKCMH